MIGLMEQDNGMDNIVECAYNMDNGYVEDKV